WTAMMFACRDGMDTVAIRLLERDDIQVNLQNKDGWSALMLACRYGMASAAIKLWE
ncbi:hypothetical protein FPQ18DRAFT_267273, partial [Pyronema domesticum]